MLTDVNAVEIATLFLAAGGIVVAGISLTINHLNRRDRLLNELPTPRTFSVYNKGLPFAYRFNVDLHGGSHANDWGIINVRLTRPRWGEYSFAVIKNGEVQPTWCRSYAYSAPVPDVSLAMPPDCAEAWLTITCVSLKLPRRKKRMGALRYTRREHS